MAVGDLELVLSCDLFHSRSRPFIAEMFPTTFGAISAAGIPYAIAGMVAYGVYARAQFTLVIDVLTARDQHGRVASVLAGLGFIMGAEADNGISFRDVASRAEVRIMVATDGPDVAALADPLSCVIFGVPSLVVKLAYLAWMFCRAGDMHLVVALINEGSLDVSNLRGLMERAGDVAALQMLADAETGALRAKSSSYSKSVEARLARRRSGGTS